MRSLDFETIADKVKTLCIETAYHLPEDVLAALRKAEKAESADLARSILGSCLENAKIAAETLIPLCQDTGTAVFLIKMGSDLHITGGTVIDAVNEGVRRGYESGFLRKSIVGDPLYARVNTKDNTPAVIHLEIVLGDRLEIAFAPKGGGSENMSAIRMLTPADGEEGVVRFVVETVKKAGGNPCPPVIVGVGIGGNFETCALSAKKALFRETGVPNSNHRYAALEQRLLTEINALGIGPQGLGGETTALAVHIETLPSHIASLAIAVNLNCHSARHCSLIL